MLCLCPSAKATTLIVEPSLVFTDGKADHELTLFVNHNIAKHVSVWSWLLVSGEWSEHLSGVTFAPHPAIELSLGAGVEQSQGLWRTTASIWVGEKEHFFFGVVEVGDSGFWFKLESNFQVLKRLGLGFFAKRFVGVGPRIEIKLHKHLSLMGAPTWDSEEGKVKGIVSLKSSFTW